MPDEVEETGVDDATETMEVETTELDTTNIEQQRIPVPKQEWAAGPTD